MRRALTLLSMAIGLAPLGAQQQASDAFELNETTIAQLQDGMAAGRYTSRRLVELYLKRIDEIDRSGPALRSVSETNPDALAIADALDAERKIEGLARPAARHPDPHQGQHRHRRSDDDHRRLARARGLASRPRDAFVVEQLRAAGAVILGKTNLSEWANFRSTKSTQRLERARRSGAQPVRRSIATRADRAPAPAPRSPRTSPPPASAPRRTDRSSARRARMVSSGSSRRSAW